MSLSRFYKTLSIYEYTEGYFDTPAGFTLKGTFQGLIQAPSNSKIFNNGKDTSTISGVLFCDINQTFGEKDIIVNGSTAYRISGMAGQDDGVAGISPRRGQHAEYNLEYVQEWKQIG